MGEKLYPEKISLRQEILDKIKQEQEATKRRTILKEIYKETRPLGLDILKNPYLGNRKTLVDEIKKLNSTVPKVQVRNILREMENIIAQLLGLGNALSVMEREVLLTGVYDKVKFLQKRPFC